MKATRKSMTSKFKFARKIKPTKNEKEEKEIKDIDISEVRRRYINKVSKKYGW